MISFKQNIGTPKVISGKMYKKHLKKQQKRSPGYFEPVLPDLLEMGCRTARPNLPATRAKGQDDVVTQTPSKHLFLV